MAEQIAGWFARSDNRRLVERLRNRGVDPRRAPRRGRALSGKTLVVTGTLEAMSREEAHEAIEAEGGKAARRVTRGIDFLVAGARPGAAKVRAAEALGIPIVDEAAFLARVGRRPR